MSIFMGQDLMPSFKNLKASLCRVASQSSIYKDPFAQNTVQLKKTAGLRRGYSLEPLVTLFIINSICLLFLVISELLCGWNKMFSVEIC